MGGHAVFLCSPPQREQMCWKRHGIMAHGLPSFQAKHATTRLLFGRGVGPLSEGPWTDLRAPPGPEDKRHLVYSAWSRRPNSAFSRDGTCWRKRESYARHQSPLSPPDRTMARYAHRSTALLGWARTTIPAKWQKALAHPSRSATGRSLCSGSGLVSLPSRERRSYTYRFSSDNSAMSTKSPFRIRRTILAGTTGRVSPS